MLKFNLYLIIILFLFIGLIGLKLLNKGSEKSLTSPPLNTYIYATALNLYYTVSNLRLQTFF